MTMSIRYYAQSYVVNPIKMVNQILNYNKYVFLWERKSHGIVCPQMMCPLFASHQPCPLKFFPFTPSCYAEFQHLIIYLVDNEINN